MAFAIQPVMGQQRPPSFLLIHAVCSLLAPWSPYLNESLLSQMLEIKFLTKAPVSHSCPAIMMKAPAHASSCFLPCGQAMCKAIQRTKVRTEELYKSFVMGFIVSS